MVEDAAKQEVTLHLPNNKASLTTTMAAPPEPTAEDGDEHPKSIILLSDGWQEIKTQGFDKVAAIIEEKNRTGLMDVLTFPREEAVDLYTKVFMMCHQVDPYNYCEELYNHHGEEVKAYLSESVKPAIGEIVETHEGDPVQLLTLLTGHWVNFLFYNKWVTNFLRVLDRDHADKQKLPRINRVTLKWFEILIFEPIEDTVTSAINQLVRNERDGGTDAETATTTKNLVVQAAAIYKALDKIHDVTRHHSAKLEETVLSETRQFYQGQRNEWATLESRSYFAEAQRAVGAEEVRCDEYLHHTISNPGASAKLRSILLEELFDNAPVEAPAESPPRGNSSGTSCVVYMPVIGLLAGGGTPGSNEKKKKQEAAPNKKTKQRSRSVSRGRGRQEEKPRRRGFSLTNRRRSSTNEESDGGDTQQGRRLSFGDATSPTASSAASFRKRQSAMRAAAKKKEAVPAPKSRQQQQKTPPERANSKRDQSMPKTITINNDESEKQETSPPSRRRANSKAGSAISLTSSSKK